MAMRIQGENTWRNDLKKCAVVDILELHHFLLEDKYHLDICTHKCYKTKLHVSVFHDSVPFQKDINFNLSSIMFSFLIFMNF